MGQQDKQKLSNLTKSQASIYSIKKKKKKRANDLGNWSKSKSNKEHNADISKLELGKVTVTFWWLMEHSELYFSCYGCFLGRWVTDSLSSPESNHPTEQHSQIRSEGYLMEWKKCGIWSQYLICWGHQQTLHHSLWSYPFHWWLEAILLSHWSEEYTSHQGCHWFCQQSWMTTLCTRCILQSAGRPLRHLPSSSQPCAGAVSEVRSPTQLAPSLWVIWT